MREGNDMKQVHEENELEFLMGFVVQLTLI